MLFTSLVIKHSLKPVFGVRYDGSPAFPYWRPSECGIEEKRFSFMSGKWKLRGSKYFIKGQKPKALIVFFHGLGDGRSSYIKEISLLAKEGYLIYAYDNTGCMESEGDCIVSFDQQLKDQRSFFAFLENDKDSEGLERYSIGHSWGGFGAMMSCKPEYKIKKCVSMAGFCQTITLLESEAKKPFNTYLKKAISSVLRSFEGEDSNLSAVDIVRQSSSKLLYIYGEKDKIVKKSCGYEPLYKAFKDEERIEFMEVKGVGHSVFRDPESEKYVGSLLKKGLGTASCPQDVFMDLEKATKENQVVWSRIFGFFSK